MSFYFFKEEKEPLLGEPEAIENVYYRILFKDISKIITLFFFDKCKIVFKLIKVNYIYLIKMSRTNLETLEKRSFRSRLQFNTYSLQHRINQDNHTIFLLSPDTSEIGYLNRSDR